MGENRTPSMFEGDFKRKVYAYYMTDGNKRIKTMRKFGLTETQFTRLIVEADLEIIREDEEWED